MRKRLSLFITLLLSVPTIIFVLLACAFLSNFLYQQKVETFEISINNIAEYIESTYEDQKLSIENSIESPELLSYLQDPTDPEKKAIASEIFFDTFTLNDTVSELSLISTDGSIYLTSNSKLLDINQSNTLIFQKVMQTDNSYTTIQYEGNLPILVIGYPIEINNKIVAIYKRLTPLNYVQYFAKNLNNSEESFYLLTYDQSGIVYETNATDMTTEISTYNSEDELSNELVLLEDILNNSKSEDIGTIKFDSYSNSTIGFYKILDELNWIVMISQPRALIYYDLYIFQILVVIVTIALILLIHLISSKFLGNYFNILNTYSNTIKKFLGGDNKIRCNIGDKLDVFGDLGNNINLLFDETEKLEIKNKDLDREITDILTIDPITRLGNNRYLYNIMDERFAKNQNQILILFNTGGTYDKLSKNFGNSIANRLLEIITKTILEYKDPYVYPVRISQDTFALFVDHFDDLIYVNNQLNEFRKKLSAITRVDDLQIELNPNLVVVHRDNSLLGRSDWLRLAAEVLKDSESEKGSFTVVDFTRIENLNEETKIFYDNILTKDSNEFIGFSKSKRRKNKK